MYHIPYHVNYLKWWLYCITCYKNVILHIALFFFLYCDQLSISMSWHLLQCQACWPCPCLWKNLWRRRFQVHKGMFWNWDIASHWITEWWWSPLPTWSVAGDLLCWKFFSFMASTFSFFFFPIYNFIMYSCCLKGLVSVVLRESVFIFSRMVVRSVLVQQSSYDP